MPETAPPDPSEAPGKAAPRSSDDATLTALIDASAALLGLTIAPAWQPAVLQNLRATAAAAALVLDFPLDDALEPAPVFRP